MLKGLLMEKKNLGKENLNRKGKYILRIEGHLNKPIRIKTNKKL